MTDLSRHRMQEAHVNFQNRGRPFDQAFRLHDAWFGAVLSDAVSFGVNPSERESLTIFFRGRPIWVKIYPS